MTNINTCTECGKPIGHQHPREPITSGPNSGRWKHKSPCPEPAYPIGEHPFPSEREAPTPTSTGGKPHKQHRDDSVKLPKRPTR